MNKTISIKVAQEIVAAVRTTALPAPGAYVPLCALDGFENASYCTHELVDIFEALNEFDPCTESTSRAMAIVILTLNSRLQGAMQFKTIVLDPGKQSWIY